MYIPADVKKLKNGGSVWVEIDWGKRRVMAGGTIVRLTENSCHALVYYEYNGRAFSRPFQTSDLKQWHDGRKPLPTT